MIPLQPRLSLAVCPAPHVTFCRLLSSKTRVLVLGSGWAGFRVARDLDKSRHEVTVISPRNHFLFTPLLLVTCLAMLTPWLLAQVLAPLLLSLLSLLVLGFKIWFRSTQVKLACDWSTPEICTRL